MAAARRVAEAVAVAPPLAVLAAYGTESETHVCQVVAAAVITATGRGVRVISERRRARAVYAAYDRGRRNWRTYEFADVQTHFARLGGNLALA